MKTLTEEFREEIKTGDSVGLLAGIVKKVDEIIKKVDEIDGVLDDL